MKLLDERGLTTVWAAIKNMFTSKLDADGKYAKKSEAIKAIKLEKTYTGGQGVTSQFIRITKANGEESFLSIYNANNTMNGFMSREDKVKLDGIESGANNYSLPIASSAVLGGIKVSENANGSSWPICVDSNGLAETKIVGLVKDGNMLSSVILSNDVHKSYYTPKGVSIEDRANKINVSIAFPAKSGALALTSDIPDVSNLCKFNFVSSISECVNGRINFLLRCPDDPINLDSFDTYPDGTILIISVSNNSVPVKHSSGGWFYGGDRVSADYTAYAYKENLKLITKYTGEIYYYDL